DRNQAGVRGLKKQVKVAPAVAGFSPDNLSIEIEAFSGHAGKVDHHSALVQTVTSRAMSAAAHREWHVVFDGELVCRGYVVGVDAHDDNSRPQINSSVVDDERLVVAGIACFEHTPGEFHSELLDIFAWNHEILL